MIRDLLRHYPALEAGCSTPQDWGVLRNWGVDDKPQSIGGQVNVLHLINRKPGKET